MPDSTKYYTVGAFALGVVLTLSWQSRKHDTGHGQKLSKRELKQYRKELLQISKIDDPDVLRKKIAEFKESMNFGIEDIKEGIEGCIGNTPLIKIKSLSEATGCEILAKAEVTNSYNLNHTYR